MSDCVCRASEWSQLRGSDDDFALAWRLLDAVALLHTRLALTGAAVEHVHAHARARRVHRLRLHAAPLVQKPLCVLVELLASNRSDERVCDCFNDDQTRVPLAPNATGVAADAADDEEARVDDGQC